jgi:asparagine synthase (glutamine-hydrolysing)
MPGIAGVVTDDRSLDGRALVTRMLHSMMHEPFYVAGLSGANELGVFAGWVAHPQSFAAATSSNDGDETLAIAFAGESFQNSEESVASRYRRLREKWVVELNGLFSGVLIDRSRNRALLFNDRYGVERVYVHEAGNAVYFASEAKALLRVLPQLRAFDDDGVAEYLTYGCPLGGKTLFRGINLLEGASLWTFEGGGCRKTRYFEPQQWEQQTPLTADEYDEEFRPRFRKALPRYTRGEGRLGISLTGGLDTRMIMACLPDVRPQPISYTFCGLHGETLDARIARRVAASCGLDHRLVRVDQDFLRDFGSYVDRTVYITDGCAGATGAHEIYLNARARELAPIRLTGNFGSEVLRGVSTFKPLGLRSDLIAPDFGPAMRAAAERVQASSPDPVTFAAFQEVPLNLFGTMAAAKSQVVFRTPYLDNELVSLAYRAPAAVRTSPGPALRLIHSEAPALSAIATDRGVSLAAGGVGYALRRFASEAMFKLDYVHKENIPRSLLPFDRAIGRLERVGLLGLHKYLPYRLWFRNDLADYVATAVSGARSLPYWSDSFLRLLAREHVHGRRNCIREINPVITLGAVQRLLLGVEHDETRRATPDVSAVAKRSSLGIANS